MTIVFISVETGAFVLSFMVYFSMPETNYSATAYGRWRCITQNIHILYYRPSKHELTFVTASLHGLELISV